MASDYIPVIILIVIGIVLATVIPVISSRLGRRRPNAAKGAPYECGVTELDSMRKRTSIRYYMTALMFIVFDIEIAFLYPWAVTIHRYEDKVFLFVEMMIFLGVLLLAYAWIWRKGALEWD